MPALVSLLTLAFLLGAGGGSASLAGPSSHTVTITSGPSGTVASLDATFTYVSTATATFTCSLDGGAATGCGSGTQGSVGYSGLALGAHRFSVFAEVSFTRPPHTARADRSWTVTQPPTPNKPPTASFTYAPPAPKPGEQVTFTSTSTDSDGRIADYVWDTDGDGVFGETGEPAGANATTAARSFAAPGSYTVQLRVTDDGGASATASQVVIVAGPPPPPPPPPPVPCPANTICFDDLKPGVEVHSQYTAQGVELGLNQSDPSGKAGVLPTIAADAGAHSGGQVAQIPPCGKDFCSSTIYAKLDHAVHHVEVYAGGGSKVALVGLNAAGVVVAKTSKITGKNAQTLLAITTLVPLIVYIQIGQDAPPGEQYGLVSLDDLRFDPPDPSAKPDFALHWLPVAPGLPLGISTGGSTSTPIYLTRFNGSKGGIKFSVKPSTLPNGLVATFSPTTVNDTSTFQTILTVTAASNAATVTPNTKLTVVGHPTSKSAALADRTLQIPLDVRLSNFDLNVTGIEVNQGIQTQLDPYYNSSGALSAGGCKLLPSLPVRDWTDPSKPVPYETTKEEPLFPASPASIAYGEGATSSGPAIHVRGGGVYLVAGRKTVVRVFASVRTPSGASLDNVPAALYGSKYGKPLPGSPLPTADDGAKTLSYSPWPWTTCLERANPKGAYTFTLPDSWTHGKIELTASVTPQDIIFGPGAECGSPTCAANNSLTLNEIIFNPLSYITVTPVQLSFKKNNSWVNPPLPYVAFNEAIYLTPATVYYDDSASEFSYSGVIDISGEMASPFLNGQFAETKEEKKQAREDLCSVILRRVDGWADDNPHGDETVGVYSSWKEVCPGTSHVHLNEDHEAFSVVAADEPYASVAHEMFHGMGRLHASECGDPAEDSWESWPPDQRGQIEGIGLDTRTASGKANGPYRVVVPGALLPGDPYGQGQPSEYNDFMSYCRKGVWISDRGWNDTFVHLERFQMDVGRLPASAHGLLSGRTLRVGAIASSLGAHVLTVKPGTGRKLTGARSSYRLVVRGGAGQVLSSRSMFAVALVGHTGARTLLLDAEVPAAGAASLEIVADGKVVARRVRSAHLPRLKLLAPPAGSRVGKGRVVVVRWRATDADGGKLEAKLDYSSNGGRRWREIFEGPSRGAARLPSTLFSGSRRARLRLRVSDGFNQSVALSKVFTAVGRPPAVRILSPAPRQRIRADGRLYLDGRAYDETGRVLRGKRLWWFAGSHRLGAGSPLSVSGLHAGLRTIRLVATDSHGRRASASVRVRLVAVPPRLLAIRAPASLSPRARRLVVRMAATMPARLNAAGKRFHLDRQLRRIVLPVRAGKGRLRIHLRLTAAGTTSRITLVVVRGRALRPERYGRPGVDRDD